MRVHFYYHNSILGQTDNRVGNTRAEKEKNATMVIFRFDSRKGHRFLARDHGAKSVNCLTTATFNDYNFNLWSGIIIKFQHYSHSQTGFR